MPALAGLGAPHWAPDARGLLTGLHLGTTRGHIARAVAEGIAASVALLVAAAIADLGRPLASLRVDGGLTRSRLLMQAQADLLQVPVLICRTPDATALGVAALARLGLGEAASVAEALGPAEVEMVVEPPLRWISPNAIGSAAPPPLDRFVLRSAGFRRGARLEVRQDGRLLARTRPARLIPERPVDLRAGWLAQVDPAGGPVRVITGAAGPE